MSEVKNIPKGWVEKTLRELGKVITGKTPSKNNPDDWGNLFDFITPSDIKSDNKYIFDCSRKLSIQGIQRFRNMILPEKSVIVTCIGSDMGKVTLNKNKALANQQINSIIVNNKNCPDFIYYLLKNSYKLLRKKAEGSGSTMPILNKSTFESMEFYIPKNINEQKSIAAILTAFDDKIELVKAQNKTLEETAQTIFAEWFGKYQIEDELPEGWKLKNLKDVCEKITDGTHSTVIDNPNGSYYLLSCKNIKNGNVIISTKDRKIDKETLIQLRKRTGLKFNDLLVTTVGTIGEVAMIREGEINYELQRSVAIIRPNLEEILPEFLYQFSRSNFFQHQALSLADGSVQSCLFLGAINSIEIIIPPFSLMLEFENLVSVIYRKLVKNNIQIQTLSKTRDELLPRLMSGKVRVKP
jgi:type I restriction enzyme S subunit